MLPTLSHTIPRRIPLRKLLLAMQHHGWNVIVDKPVSTTPITRYLYRVSAGHRQLPGYPMVFDPFPASGDYLDFEIDTTIELPLLRGALLLSESDGCPDVEFFKYP